MSTLETTIGIFSHIMMALIIYAASIPGGLNNKGSLVGIASIFGVIYFWVDSLT